MNFDFFKDLVSLNPIKTTYVANNLRNNFIFIIEDHIKEKSYQHTKVTLLEKLIKVFDLYLENKLNKDLVYNLFGNKLNLTHKQFTYLYNKINQDEYIKNLILKINTNFKQYETNADYQVLRDQLFKTIDESDGFVTIASFLVRECNNAVKIHCCD
nr:Ac75 [Cnaphalocrocis medinalis granulovirus]